jgi:hypothetical protein
MKGYGHVLGVFGKPLVSGIFIESYLIFFRPKVQETLNFEYFKIKISIKPQKVILKRKIN